MQTEEIRSESRPVRPRTFNATDRFAEGWYWAIKSRDLGPGRVKAVRLQGRNLAVYRTAQGRAVAMDAYCPHMGAHLAEGRVVGEELRCFFHDWAFGPNGKNTDVPSLGRPVKACVKTWPTEERYGMVWVWTGDAPATPLPFAPELEGLEASHLYGIPWVKACHPNVVMVNAIDAHHFNTVHHFPVNIEFESKHLSQGAMTFRNTTRGGKDSYFIKLIRPFYKEAVTYDLCYWFGSTGTVTVGPDFLHCYIMFTSRLGDDGEAEGQTILLTRKRSGPLGWLVSAFALFLSFLVGNYFAKGDTEVFRSIRFDIQTPVGPDQSVLDFVKYVDDLPSREFGTWEEIGREPRLEALPDEDPAEHVA